MNKKTRLALALSGLLPCALPQTAAAVILDFNWSGYMIALDSGGEALANSSIPPKGNNQYRTSVSGTLTYDTVSQSGSVTLVPFDFFSNDPTLPFEAFGWEFNAIGDGQGGSGDLMLSNMLFGWNGNNGIPVSLVWDASGLLDNLAGVMAGGPGTTLSGVGATPASDGTYLYNYVPGTTENGPGGYPGYLGQGPAPFATTAWNTTSRCTRAGVMGDGSCMGLSPSGALPLIFDSATNNHDYSANTGGNIGGNPMDAGGPFEGSNFNFDFTSLTLTSTAVPVPAAVWLFGSGLIGLIGVARAGRSAHRSGIDRPHDRGDLKA